MEALELLQTLVDQPLCYGLKSPDTDLYDFGFGNMENSMNPYEGGKKPLHLFCMLYVGLE